MGTVCLPAAGNVACFTRRRCRITIAREARPGLREGGWEIPLVARADCIRRAVSVVPALHAHPGLAELSRRTTDGDAQRGTCRTVSHALPVHPNLPWWASR